MPLFIKHFFSAVRQNTHSEYKRAERQVLDQFHDWKQGKTIISVDFGERVSRWEEDNPGSFINVMYESETE
jgi:hypothetical protein